MRFSHLACELAIVAILCILSVFFCPASVGPYPAVHGPVTALQALGNFIKLCCAMAVAAFALREYVPILFRGGGRCRWSFLLPDSLSPRSILRC
jgi:hypothetical protein